MPDQATDKQENRPKKSTYFNNYVKYSAFGFQLIALFVIFSLGGNWLDKWVGNKFPAFTLTGVALALVVVFYLILKIIKDQDKS